MTKDGAVWLKSAPSLMLQLHQGWCSFGRAWLLRRARLLSHLDFLDKTVLVSPFGQNCFVQSGQNCFVHSSIKTKQFFPLDQLPFAVCSRDTCKRDAHLYLVKSAIPATKPGKSASAD
jgi:hypothetical protein